MNSAMSTMDPDSTDLKKIFDTWLRYSFSDISFQCVCSCVGVYDVGCFVDVLASRSGYSGRKPSVPMIAILLAPRWVCR